MSELTSRSVVDLARGLRDKEFSSVELTSAFLERAKRHSHLNAFIELAESRAIEEAKRADEKLAKNTPGRLLGVPVAVKDMILTKDIRTTAGSKILSNFIPPYDATVVRRIKEEGAVILGKTNQDEFGMGSSNENSAYGAVRNPWNTEYVPGGSSGGSGAAVAARLAPISLATDTGGSVRLPASWCGLVGIKPTYGRVSRYGVIAYASSLDQVGVLANSVEDAGLLTEIIAGHDTLDATSSVNPVPEFSKGLAGSVKGLRVGIPKEYFIEGLSPEVRASINASLSTLEKLGAHLVEISLPSTEMALATYYIIAPAEASSNLSRYDGVRYGTRTSGGESLSDLYSRSRSEGFGAEVKRRIIIGNYVLSSGYYDAFYLKAQKVRSLVTQDFITAFNSQCDVIAAPVSPVGAFKLGEKIQDPLAMYLIDIFTVTINLAGLPAMVVPCGFDSNGLPMGLQLIGRHWDEKRLIDTAAVYESNTEWHKRVPPIQ